jgi:hypothetical protein
VAVSRVSPLTLRMTILSRDGRTTLRTPQDGALIESLQAPDRILRGKGADEATLGGFSVRVAPDPTTVTVPGPDGRIL